MDKFIGKCDLKRVERADKLISEENITFRNKGNDYFSTIHGYSVHLDKENPFKSTCTCDDLDNQYKHYMCKHIIALYLVINGLTSSKKIEGYKAYYKLENATEEERDNYDICLLSVKKNHKNLEFISDRLKHDKTFILEALDYVKDISIPYKYYNEILECNMYKHRNLIDDDLLQDRDIALKCIKKGFVGADLYKDTLFKDDAFIKELVEFFKEKPTNMNYCIPNMANSINHEMLLDYNFVKKLVEINPNNFIYLPDNYKDDENLFFLGLSKKNVSIDYINSASLRIKDNKDIMLKASAYTENITKCISSRLNSDIDFWYELIKTNPNCIIDINDNLFDNKEFANELFSLFINKNIEDKFKLKEKLIVIKEIYLNNLDPWHHKLTEEIKNLISNDRDLFIVFLNVNSKKAKDVYEMFKVSSDEIKSDTEIAVIAINIEPKITKFLNKDLYKEISEKLKNNKYYVLNVIHNEDYYYDTIGVFPFSSKNTETILNECSIDLKDDEEFVFKCFSYGFCCERYFMYASDRLKDDKDFVLKCININRRVIEYVSDRLKDDIDVVKESMKRYPRNFYYASDRLKDNKELAFDAVKLDTYNYEYISDRLKQDKDISEYIVNVNPDLAKRFSNLLNQEAKDLLLQKDKKSFLFKLSKICEMQYEELKKKARSNHKIISKSDTVYSMKIDEFKKLEYEYSEIIKLFKNDEDVIRKVAEISPLKAIKLLDYTSDKNKKIFIEFLEMINNIKDDSIFYYEKIGLFDLESTIEDEDVIRTMMKSDDRLNMASSYSLTGPKLKENKKLFLDAVNIANSKTTEHANYQLITIFKHMGESLKKDVSLVSMLKDKYFENIYLFGNLYSDDKEIVLNYLEKVIDLKENYPYCISEYIEISIEWISDRLKNDYDIAKIVLDHNVRYLRYFGETIKDNKKIIIEYLNKLDCGRIYASDLSDILKDDEDVMLELIKQRPSEFSYASDRLKHDISFVRKVVTISGEIYNKLDDEFKNNKEIYLLAKKTCPSIRSNTLVLPELKEIYLDQAKKSPAAIAKFEECYQHDKDIFLASLRKGKTALKYLNDDLRKDPDVINLVKTKYPDRLFELTCEEKLKQVKFNDKILTIDEMVEKIGAKICNSIEDLKISILPDYKNIDSKEIGMYYHTQFFSAKSINDLFCRLIKSLHCCCFNIEKRLGGKYVDDIIDFYQLIEDKEPEEFDCLIKISDVFVKTSKIDVEKWDKFLKENEIRVISFKGESWILFFQEYGTPEIETQHLGQFDRYWR